MEKIDFKSVFIGIFIAMFIFNMWYGIQVVKASRANQLPAQIEAYLQGGINAGFFPSGDMITQKLNDSK